MRKFALAMVLAATSVQAAEQLKFGDVNYFIKTGEINVLADVSSTYDKFSQDGGDTLETRGILVESRLAYGFHDQLNFFLGLDYAYDREVENKTTTADSNYDQVGLGNPILGANYRLMNQNAEMFNFDVGAVARINIEDAEIGSADGGSVENGNFAQPRGSLELNARIGKKWDEANEWQLAAGVVYLNSGEYTLLNPNGSDLDGDLDASMDVYVRATYQYRPVNEFMILVSLQATRVGEVEGDIEGSSTKDDSHIDGDFRFTAKYLITDNFIAKFNYGQAFMNQEFERDNGVSTFDIDRRRESFWGLGVEFLF